MKTGKLSVNWRYSNSWPDFKHEVSLKNYWDISTILLKTYPRRIEHLIVVEPDYFASFSFETTIDIQQGATQINYNTKLLKWLIVYFSRNFILLEAFRWFTNGNCIARILKPFHIKLMKLTVCQIRSAPTIPRKCHPWKFLYDLN